jgi:paraquat-inducible protein A
MPESDSLVACPDCDALQALSVHPVPTRHACWRCGAGLDVLPQDRLERILALAIAAAVCYLIANFAPLVHVNMQGDQVVTTLTGAASALWAAGMEPIAALVFISTVALPGVYLCAMLYLVGGVLYLERAPGRQRLPFADLALRAAQHAQSWSMLEVFLVGALVAVVRLQPVALVNVTIGLWAVGALVLMFATLAGWFHPRYLWSRLDRAAVAR